MACPLQGGRWGTNEAFWSRKLISDLQHYVSLERLYWEQSLTGSSGFCHCLDNEAANCSWWMLVEPVGWLEPRSLQGNKQIIFSHNTALLLSFLLVLTLCFSGWRYVGHDFHFSSLQGNSPGQVFKSSEVFIPWKWLYKLLLHACAQVGGGEPESGSARSQSYLQNAVVIFAWEYFGRW